jgi:hypothetical protein
MIIEIDVRALAVELAGLIEVPVASGNRWLTLVEAAEYLRCSSRWVKSNAHVIPHRRVAGRLLFDRVELDGFVMRGDS